MTFSQKYWLTVSVILLLVGINICLFGRLIRWTLKHDVPIEVFVLMAICLGLMTFTLPMFFVGPLIYGW